MHVAPVPVICDSCERLWFQTNLIDGPDGSRITFENVMVGPCPYCGKTGHIVDGVYEITQGATRLLASQLTARELRALRAILVSAQQTGESPQETAKQIAEKVPKASSIAPLLTQEVGTAAQLLALIVAVITLILTLRAGERASLTPQQVAQIAVAAAREVQHPIAPRAVAPRTAKQTHEPLATRQTRARLGPMDDCWCRSGSKYKHCHGRR